MGSIFKVLLLLFVLSACAQAPIQRNTDEWLLTPADPDLNLTIDDQFLQKSQHVNTNELASKLRKKIFLNP